MPLQILCQQAVGGLYLLHLRFVEVGLLCPPVQFQGVQVQQQFQHLDAEVGQFDLLRHRIELLEDVVHRGRPVDHPGVAAGAEFLLEPPQIHRELPHPCLQGLGGKGQGKPDGNAVVVGERKGEVALVLQPAVQFQVPGLHIGVGIRPRRVLHPALAAVVDAQHIFRGAEHGVIPWR